MSSCKLDVQVFECTYMFIATLALAIVILVGFVGARWRRRQWQMMT